MNGIPEETGVLLFTNISSDIDKFKRWQNIIINCGTVASDRASFAGLTAVMCRSNITGVLDLS